MRWATFARLVRLGYNVLCVDVDAGKRGAPLEPNSTGTSASSEDRPDFSATARLVGSGVASRQPLPALLGSRTQCSCTTCSGTSTPTRSAAGLRSCLPRSASWAAFRMAWHTRAARCATARVRGSCKRLWTGTSALPMPAAARTTAQSPPRKLARLARGCTARGAPPTSSLTSGHC
eukprot:5097630-Prymnesium_polylepis.1